ncbi:hypothetical protein C8J98_101524 [Luteibacter sp. OK325]|uniref:dermonecrotic toxin domain-containing protein n=1 Tax=Luteibacter sp. OK325 TaxID=2135670 RepID=UPI000D3A02AF|nr:DUF6543 domain-containing protein [Luteibacter sp. OK325]PTR35261.1 hypothetical protein C8J98_101524 [Luteibacter sp. OK325]
MDVQPTTSPEVVQSESQAAVDALRRLAATSAAIDRLYEGQPSLAEANAQGAQALLDALPTFWSSAQATGGEVRSIALARHLADVMKEEATLRGLDGTLGQAAAALATRVAATNTGVLPAGVHARELLLGESPHAGSLVVVDDRMPDLALLFTAHGGWEAFDSLERLLNTTRRRLLESVDPEDAFGLEADALAEAKLRGTVGTRELTGGIFDALATRMIDVQLARIALAADDHGLDSDEPDAATRLGDRIRYELSPAAMLDIHAIERLREAMLLEAAMAQRLAGVPDDVRTAWYEARDSYNDTLAAAAMFRMAAGAQAPLTLRAFASRELAAKLATLGIDDSPEAITVEIARIKVLPGPLAAFDPLPGSTTPRQMSLVELACQNIGRFSLDTLHAKDAKGTSLRDRLGHGAVRDMVRDLDIANRHQAHVEQRLRQGPVGALARKLAMTVQVAQMRLEAAEARLSYYLPGEPRSFIDDRDERGFRWVSAALDTPTSQRQVDKHDIVASQIIYRQAALDGILVFASRTPASASRVVMYTPDAPDGISFREFEDRQDAAKRFLYHPAFREYLLDRLPAEFATVSSNGATRRFAGDRLAHWVLGASGDASYTQTVEPFDEREVRGDFLAATYDATVEKYRRDARFLARTTAGADNDALLGYLQTRLNPPAHLAEVAVMDVPASLARMIQASWRFYDHVKAGDTGQAFVAFTDGYVNALNLVVPPYIGGRHIAGAIVRSRTATRGVASSGVRLTTPQVRFDDRYAARGLRKPGKPDQEGIFRVRGQSYVEQEGTLFLVRHDADYGRWRLAPSRGALDANFTGPLIERVDDRWVYALDVGLRGGMRRLRERLRRVAIRDDAAPAGGLVPDGAAVAGPAPNPAAPAAPAPIAMPAVMEPFRAEITAALIDNPSANALVRDDGAYMKLVVKPRSAMILDPLLHPDIAELSAHQRRVFLHELDTRFVLATERAEVLRVRGYAQSDGRRLPSPPPSPGVAQGIDIQSPSISSSTGDPLPPAPTLSPSQQGRWDDALAVARSTPRVPPRRSGASTSATVTEGVPASELVPPDEWPDRMWYFSDRLFEREVWPLLNREGITLGHDAAWVDTARGTRTYPVSVLPPEMPAARLSEALGTSPIQQAGQRDPLAYAMQIDTVHLRDPWRWVGPHHAVPGPGASLELRRRLLPNGEYQYLLQSSQPIRIYSEHIIDLGRRGRRPAPYSALRH